LRHAACAERFKKLVTVVEKRWLCHLEEIISFRTSENFLKFGECSLQRRWFENLAGFDAQETEIYWCFSELAGFGFDRSGLKLIRLFKKINSSMVVGVYLC
jgi:hypothetical protein